MNAIQSGPPSRRRLLQLGATAVCGLGFSNQPSRAATDQDIVRLDCTPANFPPLTIAGDDYSRTPDGNLAAFRGFADPCIRHAPDGTALWMAYSWPHMEYPVGASQDVAVGVETHLAVSNDAGKSWQREKVLWPKTPASFINRRTSTARRGFMSHEVPNILPCRVDGNPLWLGIRLDYFLGQKSNYRDRENLSFCLRLMAASTPAELTNAAYVTFGHDLSSPECAVDVNLTTLSADFPSAFIPNEPALFFKDGRLYLAFVCMTFNGRAPDFGNSFIAVMSTEPHGGIRSWQWRYHGKLAESRDAQELGGESLTQIELALARDGRLLAFLTPESWHPEDTSSTQGDVFFGIRHHGCAVVEVASLDQPALARRSNGKLAVRAILEASGQSAHGPGATAYDRDSETGVVFTLRDMESGKNLGWDIHPTRLHP